MCHPFLHGLTPVFRARWLPALLVIAVVAPPLTATQAQTPLTLPQAVRLALENSPVREAARASEQAAAAGVREARSALLPSFTVSESLLRSNDPVFAFGTKLRQQRFTADDFALDSLNDPAALNDFNTRLTARWNLYDFGRSSNGLAAAHRVREAAESQFHRTEQELIFRVVEAYYGLLLARRQQEVAEKAVGTAEAILERTRTSFEAGLVVESDLLSARVNLAARQQELIEARNHVELAKALLNHEMGVPAGSVYEPSEVLDEAGFSPPALPELEAQALAVRPDLEEVRRQEAAQLKSLASARAALLPRIGFLAAWERHDKDFLHNGSSNWTAGIQVDFDLFQGGALRARIARESALHDRVASLRDQAESGVRLEVRQASLQVRATAEQVEVARTAVSQAEESLRILTNRYGAGLASITDLLQVEDAANAARTRYWGAVYRFQLSRAGLELATGTLAVDSPVVTSAGSQP